MSARSIEDRQAAGQEYVTVVELQARLGVTPEGATRMAEAAGQPTSGYIGRAAGPSPIVAGRLGGAA